jgi:hypothetical protein
MRLFIFAVLGISTLFLACPPPYYDLKFGYNGELKKTLNIEKGDKAYEIKGSYRNFYDYDVANIIIKDLSNKSILYEDSVQPISFKSNAFLLDNPIRVEDNKYFAYLQYRHKSLDSATIGELQYWLDSTYLKLSLSNILGKACTIDVIIDKSGLFKLCAGSDFPMGKVYLTIPENQGIRFLHFATLKNPEYAVVESYVIDKNSKISRWFPKISSHPPIVALTDTLLNVKYTYDIPDAYYADIVFSVDDSLVLAGIDKQFTVLSNLERLCACRNAVYKWQEKDRYMKILKKKLEHEITDSLYFVLTDSIDTKLLPKLYRNRLNEIFKYIDRSIEY